MKAKIMPRKYASVKYTTNSTTPITTFPEKIAPIAVIPNSPLTTGHPQTNSNTIATPISAIPAIASAPPLKPTAWSINATTIKARITSVAIALGCKN